MDTTLGPNSNLQNQHTALREVTTTKSAHCPPPPPPSPATPVKTPRKYRKVVKKGGNQGAGQTPKSSLFRGVTKHRYTGRYEVHLWDKFSWNLSQNKRGKQVYVGSFNKEQEAAYTYDLAALKYFGPHCFLNFPLHTYIKELAEMKSVSNNEYIARLRRNSSGFARGESKYRGVTKHYKKGRWEARIGNVCGRKYLYLGSFSSEEEAAKAYDIATLYFRGPNAITNFDINKYQVPTIHGGLAPPPPPLFAPTINGGFNVTSENLINFGISSTIGYDESLNYGMDQNGMSWNMCMGAGFGEPTDSSNATMLQNGAMEMKMGNHFNVAANQGSSNVLEYFGGGMEYVDMDTVYDAATSNQFGNLFSNSGDASIGDDYFHGIDGMGADFGGAFNVGGDQAPGATGFAGFGGNVELPPFPSF